MVDLLDGEIKQVDPIQFETWGVQAADDFLKLGTPLNTVIKKIAVDNSLNPRQISRVVEVANNAANLALFKTAKDKTYEFDLADTKKIVTELNIKSERENPDIPPVYIAGPPEIKVACKTFSDFISMGSMGKQASIAPPLRVKDKKGEILDKIAQERSTYEKSRVEYTHAIFALEALRKEAHRTLETMLITKKASVPELVESFAQVIPECKSTGMQVLQEVIDRIKKTAAVVSDSLFERHPGVRVVNGSHPVFGLIKQIYDEENRGAQSLVASEMCQENIRDLKKCLVSEEV